jgi:hypothetical protein
VKCAKKGKKLWKERFSSGLSIFEEAQFHGVEAAQTTLAHIAGAKRLVLDMYRGRILPT